MYPFPLVSKEFCIKLTSCEMHLYILLIYCYIWLFYINQVMIVIFHISRIRAFLGKK